MQHAIVEQANFPFPKTVDILQTKINGFFGNACFNPCGHLTPLHNPSKKTFGAACRPND